VGRVVSESVADLELPFNVAVRLADWSEAKAPVLAVNVAEVAFAGTVTEGGTVSTDGALFERVTTLVPAVDLERVTVQVVLALGARLPAAHCRDETVGRVVRDRLAIADGPCNVAVTVAL